MKALKRALILACGVLGTCVLLYCGWLFWLYFTLDDTYKEEQDYNGDLIGIEYQFRAYFHGKTNYPAYTLDQLRTMGIVNKYVDDDLKAYHGKYTPFSSNTPDNTIVLRFDFNWFEPDVFTKKDLTTAQYAPDQSE